MRYRLLTAVVGITLSAAGAFAGVMDAKTVVVSGFAQQMVRPDLATVRIGVVAIDKTTSKALDANNALMRKVLDAIKAEGVPESAVQTTDFRILAQHPRRDGEGYAYGLDETVTNGYRVTNTLTVTITDLRKVSIIIDAATRAGANMSNSVKFDVKDRQALETKLLAEAVRDARRNAEIMAGAENVKVGKLIAVTNTPPSPPQWNERLSSMDRAPGLSMETVVITEGVVPVSAQVMAIYVLE